MVQIGKLQTREESSITYEEMFELFLCSKGERECGLSCI